MAASAAGEGAPQAHNALNKLFHKSREWLASSVRHPLFQSVQRPTALVAASAPGGQPAPAASVIERFFLMEMQPEFSVVAEAGEDAQAAGDAVAVIGQIPAGGDDEQAALLLSGVLTFLNQWSEQWDFSAVIQRSFVMTGAAADRKYVFALKVERVIVCAISAYPVFNFAQKLFGELLDLVEHCSVLELSCLLHRIVYCTVAPVPGIRYNLLFEKSPVPSPIHTPTASLALSPSAVDAITANYANASDGGTMRLSPQRSYEDPDVIESTTSANTGVARRSSLGARGSTDDLDSATPDLGSPDAVEEQDTEYAGGDGSTATAAAVAAGTTTYDEDSVGVVLDWGLNHLQPFDKSCTQAMSFCSAYILVKAWEALLLEKRVLVVSYLPVLLPPICELLTTLLQPMIWPHTFIPILPPSLVDTLEAPLPFLIGIDAQTFMNTSADTTDVLVINLDQNTLALPPDFPQFPPEIENALLREAGLIMSAAAEILLGHPIMPQHNSRTHHHASSVRRNLMASDGREPHPATTPQDGDTSAAAASSPDDGLGGYDVGIRHTGQAGGGGRIASVEASFRQPMAPRQDMGGANAAFHQRSYSQTRSQIPLKAMLGAASAGGARVMMDSSGAGAGEGAACSGRAGVAAGAGAGGSLQRPLSVAQLNALQDVFSTQLLRLLCARDCNLRAFFRDAEVEQEPLPNGVGPTSYSKMVPFCGQGEYSHACGCLHMLQEGGGGSGVDVVLRWVEMDTYGFFVYEHADDLPLFWFPVRDIEAVAPSNREPEGLVFEVQIPSRGQLYCFCTVESSIRDTWIRSIEQIIWLNRGGAHHDSVASDSSGADSPGQMGGPNGAGGAAGASGPGALGLAHGGSCSSGSAGSSGGGGGGMGTVGGGFESDSPRRGPGNGRRVHGSGGPSTLNAVQAEDGSGAAGRVAAGFARFASQDMDHELWDNGTRQYRPAITVGELRILIFETQTLSQLRALCRPPDVSNTFGGSGAFSISRDANPDAFLAPFLQEPDSTSVQSAVDRMLRWDWTPYNEEFRGGSAGSKEKQQQPQQDQARAGRTGSADSDMVLGRGKGSIATSEDGQARDHDSPQDDSIVVAEEPLSGAEEKTTEATTGGDPTANADATAVPPAPPAAGSSPAACPTVDERENSDGIEDEDDPSTATCAAIDGDTLPGAVAVMAAELDSLWDAVRRVDDMVRKSRTESNRRRLRSRLRMFSSLASSRVLQNYDDVLTVTLALGTATSLREIGLAGDASKFFTFTSPDGLNAVTSKVPLVRVTSGPAATATATATTTASESASPDQRRRMRTSFSTTRPSVASHVSAADSVDLSERGSHPVSQDNLAFTLLRPKLEISQTARAEASLRSAFRVEPKPDLLGVKPFIVHLTAMIRQLKASGDVEASNEARLVRFVRALYREKDRDYVGALRDLERSHVLDQSKISAILARVQKPFETCADVRAFLDMATKIGPTVGLEAYRVVTERVGQWLWRQATRKTNDLRAVLQKASHSGRKALVQMLRRQEDSPFRNMRSLRPMVLEMGNNTLAKLSFGRLAIGQSPAFYLPSPLRYTDSTGAPTGVAPRTASGADINRVLVGGAPMNDGSATGAAAHDDGDGNLALNEKAIWAAPADPPLQVVVDLLGRLVEIVKTHAYRTSGGNDGGASGAASANGGGTSAGGVGSGGHSSSMDSGSSISGGGGGGGGGGSASGGGAGGGVSGAAAVVGGTVSMVSSLFSSDSESASAVDGRMNSSPAGGRSPGSALSSQLNLQSRAGKPLISRTRDGTVHVRLSLELLASIRESTAFRQFELLTGKLRSIDPNEIGQGSERLAFFLNLYNLMCMHAVIERGQVWNSLYSHVMNMNEVRYVLGERDSRMVFTPIEIEQNILRAHSSKPSYLAIFTPTFPQNDPRREFQLQEAQRLVTFGLNSCVFGCPPIHIFAKPDRILDELKLCAGYFLKEMVQIDERKHRVVLPELLRYYWRDWGTDRVLCLRSLTEIMDPAMGQQVLRMLERGKVKVTFSSSSWAASFSFYRM